MAWLYLNVMDAWMKHLPNALLPDIVMALRALVNGFSAACQGRLGPAKTYHVEVEIDSV